ncbi:hypothetical protein EMO89_01530 [Bifidobacterium tissieri]|uniref:Uncharacterized protein n=1 Tax=Bifidobacterium tissieri TaxID=1630162 RepID=A0A5M9ZVB9_9BIFI|nr:hypothetical protein [Bifidobacterium tissieri]KAA8831445.1 hypothetical protein EMO89_01530 [Bifidobacterium tissieri]
MSDMRLYLTNGNGVRLGMDDPDMSLITYPDAPTVLTISLSDQQCARLEQLLHEYTHRQQTGKDQE